MGALTRQSLFNTRGIFEWQVCRCGSKYILHIPIEHALFKRSAYSRANEARALHDFEVASHRIECLNKKVKEYLNQHKEISQWQER